MREAEAERQAQVHAQQQRQQPQRPEEPYQPQQPPLRHEQKQMAMLPQSQVQVQQVQMQPEQPQQRQPHQFYVRGPAAVTMGAGIAQPIAAPLYTYGGRSITASGHIF